MDFRGERRAKGTVVLEITPLVDIVFLLLIFFLLTATYVKNPSLDISLPKASLNQVTSHKKDLAIAVKKDGEIRYDNQGVSFERLEGILRAEYSENKEAIVVIRADKESMHGRVVEVMDLAKKIGFAKLAIAIQAKSAPIE
ncbi:MAG: biopolymer transporter ExbD [Deltaproteobacteria bacterium]|nr:biopolymer transporter ExbD [Deltaproteobacteria bacterium]